MVEAIVTTGLQGIGFDEGRYYALIEFSTDGDPHTVALPPEFLGQLAEASLAMAPQVADLGNDEESQMVFRAREGTVTPTDEGGVVLRMAFGKQAEIRFLLPPGGAEALLAGLQQVLAKRG